MRKELSDTYTLKDDGGVGVKARKPEGGVIQYDLTKRDLKLEVPYMDSQGTKKTGEVLLRPVVASVLRVDNILPSENHLFYLAALNCYTGLSTDKLVKKAKEDSKEEINRFLAENVTATGHWSVLEHRGPSFLIDGVSRAYSHQQVRHRLLSFSQQSQRYLDLANSNRMEKGETIFPFIVPPSIRCQPELVEQFLETIKTSLSGYYSLRAQGAYPEDARFLFPNAANTRILISGNHRVWLELIPKRTCGRAQWEIDMVVTEIARQLFENLPNIYYQVGPVCSSGNCDQGKRSCGHPLKNSLAAFYNDDNYPHDQLIFGMR